MPKHDANSTILFLAPDDELRPLYENALQPETQRLIWFNSAESLLKFETSGSPHSIILDLDATNQSIESLIQQIRSTFGQTAIIALSTNDTAHLALQCIRSGCADFLVKPTSPEELAWSVRKIAQSHAFLDRITTVDGESIRAVNLISSANTASLVQLYSTEYLKKVFHGHAAAWVENISDEPAKLTTACSVPREANAADILFEFPSTKGTRSGFLLRAKRSGARKIFVATASHGGVFVTGVTRRPTRKAIETAKLVIEHSEVCLANLQKVEAIKQQTFVDDLTELYNSRYLKFSLTNAIARCKTPDQNFSVLFIDVDHFKKINDNHGHLVGSEFLIAIARAIKHTVRNIDLVFRYGGDEFVILLHQTGVNGAREIAERIRKHIERRVFNIQGVRIQTTVTIGLATYPVHAADKDELLRLADEAMYSAKRLSRNAVHLAGQ